MKIESVVIQGFRGFNQEKELSLHPSLTLIYAPNSYGKTSISEAVEWLLYGQTSKVDRGESKEEYKGSYRNCHIDAEKSTFVRLSLSGQANATQFEAKLVGDDGFERFVDGNAVDQWPIDTQLAALSRPFIMQHALKYLLLVAPDERFKGFAHLLGLDQLGDMQSDFVSFCTKPEVSIPEDVNKFYARINAIVSRLAVRPNLKNVYNLYKKGKGSYTAFAKCILDECKSRVPESTPDESVLPNLLRIRDQAVKKVFSGSVTLPPYNEEDKISDVADSTYFLSFVSDDLINKYCELVALSTRDVIIHQAEFYRVGLEFMAKQPDHCPFCGQKLNKTIAEQITNEHQRIKSKSERSSVLSKQRQATIDALAELKLRYDRCQRRHLSRLNTFLLIEPSFDQLTKILMPKNESYVNSVRAALIQIKKCKNLLDTRYAAVSEALSGVQLSVQQSREDATLIKELGKQVVAYSNAITSTVTLISVLVTPMSDANEIIKHELDSVAGTEDVSLLIDLTENLKDINKVFEIDFILAGLKELRKTVDQYVGSKMLDAVANEMTGDVMAWYNQIRTAGDPDVHFSGFDMERTKKGDIKSRRVQIKASSYGKNLVSAVSSLSESKLNALGLCMSIATNLKPGCPFSFLFIDDPIQSWDEEHGAQFIEIVQKLIDKGKQVIILSHNNRWLQQLRTGCRSLNGFYYEITSYTKAGPIIVQKDWCSWKQRLDEVKAIINDQNADSVRLQNAEAEIRLAVSDLTSVLYSKKKNQHKDANKFNSAQVRKCLVECGLPLRLIDQIGQTFETTDDAHHVTDYSAQRERILRYCNYIQELAKCL